MNTVQLTINERSVTCAPDSTILEAAQSAGISIPTLCFLKDCNRIAACRMCVVEVEGGRALMPACATKVRDGMVVRTESPAVQDSRRRTLDLIFRHHNTRCEYCSRYSDCELHALLRRMGMNEHLYETGQRAAVDDSTRAIVRDNSKCVTCRRCVSVCTKVQGLGVLKALRSAGQTVIGTDGNLAESGCIQCGACVAACPTGALSVFSEMEIVAFALRNKRGRKIAAVVAAEAAEKIGPVFYDGRPERKKLNAALRKLGFDAVVDRNELGGILCCPAVERYISQRHPALADRKKDADRNAFAELRVKIAQKLGVSEHELFLVSISPCTAEKGADNGADVTLTTVETAELIRHQCVSRFTANDLWNSLDPESFDPLDLKRTERRSRAVSGLKAVEEALLEIENGTLNTEDVSLWACLGGCENGGGQPRTQRSGF